MGPASWAVDQCHLDVGIRGQFVQAQEAFSNMLGLELDV